jgi:sodium-dependent phosphate cotransporter
VPLIFLGISYLFTQDSKGLTVLGSFVVIIVFFVCLWLGYFCQYNGGKEKCYDCMQNRQARHMAVESLPEDMQFLKAKIQALSEHTGLPEEEEVVDAEDDIEAAKGGTVEVSPKNVDDNNTDESEEA